jgi:hypothetical protein
LDLFLKELEFKVELQFLNSQALALRKKFSNLLEILLDKKKVSRVNL